MKTVTDSGQRIWSICFDADEAEVLQQFLAAMKNRIGGFDLRDGENRVSLRCVITDPIESAAAPPPAPGMREAFEAWAKTEFIRVGKPHKDGSYGDFEIQAAWSAWQATQPSRVAQLPPCAECGAELRCSYDWHHKVLPGSAPPDEKPTAFSPTVTHGTGVPK